VGLEIHTLVRKMDQKPHFPSKSVERLSKALDVAAERFESYRHAVHHVRL
jgi:hypothetical protein